VSVIFIDSDGMIVEELRSNQRKIMEALDSLGFRLGKVETNMARVDDELASLRDVFTGLLDRLADAEDAARQAEDALRTALENDAIDDATQAQALTATLDNSAADKIAALRADVQQAVAPQAPAEPGESESEPGEPGTPAEEVPVEATPGENPPGTGV
jgi:peptidoglycan hydrolase CwlO-like protein